jgi:hypothetical protein
MSLGLSKGKSENWLSYLRRLASINILSDDQIKEWLDGKSLKVGGATTVFEFETNQRYRTIPQIKSKKSKDGTIAEEVVEETQSFLIRSLARRTTEFYVEIPLKGKVSDSATNDVNFSVKIEAIPEEEQELVFKQYSDSIIEKSRKKAGEKWIDYVERLRELNFINDQHVEGWNNQLETLLVPLMLVSESVQKLAGPRKFLRSGEVLEYTRDVPFSRRRQLLLALPAKKTNPLDCEACGFFEVDLD